MARRSDSALASLLLTDRLTGGTAKPLAPGEYWGLVAQVEDPARLLGLDAQEIARRLGSTSEMAERISLLLGAGTQLAFELERLEQEGYRVLSPFDEGYPQRLTTRLQDVAPPVLVAVGDTRLLQDPGIGIVGSRDVSPAGVSVAHRVAALAAERGMPVISGGARGVDQQSMAAAYQAGGSVVGVLAESLTKRVRDPETRRVIAEGQVCLLTPYKPDAGFSVANAMGRNKLIYALSRVTIVIASDDGRGGTWEGATESLRRGYGAVAVWMGDGAGPGNRAIADRGGSRVEDLEDESWLDPRPLEPAKPPREVQLNLGY